MMTINTQLNIPKDWLQIKTIDMHTGGEPLRVILDGYPTIEGNSVLERRRYLMDHYDYLRTALMWEPRGHADMYGCIITPPNDEEADFGIIFLHNEGYSTMCGHATIAITKLAIELGWVPKQAPETKVVIDAPCGRLYAYAIMKNETVEAVRFHCVPSFVVALDQHVEVAGLGKINYDLAYGGAFYAYVDANQLNLSLTPENYAKHTELGMRIKRAVMTSNQAIHHPFEADLSFLYGTIFIGGPVSEGIDSRNICVFAEGEVDRCPTGSGVSGRMAIHFKRQEIALGEHMLIEGITGSVFKGAVVKTIPYGPYEAVIPEVEGTAFITGTHTFLIDPQDPMKNGFFLR
ncbi:MAG: proline racemase family protein [Flammeovirgaceae bacterium]